MKKSIFVFIFVAIQSFGTYIPTVTINGGPTCMPVGASMQAAITLGLEEWVAYLDERVSGTGKGSDGADIAALNDILADIISEQGTNNVLIKETINQSSVTNNELSTMMFQIKKIVELQETINDITNRGYNER